MAQDHAPVKNRLKSGVFGPGNRPRLIRTNEYRICTRSLAAWILGQPHIGGGRLGLSRKPRVVKPAAAPSHSGVTAPPPARPRTSFADGARRVARTAVGTAHVRRAHVREHPLPTTSHRGRSLARTTPWSKHRASRRERVHAAHRKALVPRGLPAELTLLPPGGRSWKQPRRIRRRTRLGPHWHEPGRKTPALRTAWQQLTARRARPARRSSRRPGRRRWRGRTCARAVSVAHDRRTSESRRRAAAPAQTRAKARTLGSMISDYRAARRPRMRRGTSGTRSATPLRAARRGGERGHYSTTCAAMPSTSTR